MASAVDAAKSLIRTAVRTFFANPRHSIIVDLLLAYKVLHVDEIGLFFGSSQPKETRALLNPLVAARLISKGTRAEVKVGAGSNRATQREYHFVNYHEAVDAIKYRLVKLREKVEDIYKEEQGKRKDWFCRRCGAEYDEFAILDKVDVERGFYCERCGETLEQNEAAVRERGNHEKIRILNDQMIPFNKLIAIIDAADVPQNDFETAFATKRDLPGDLAAMLKKRAGWMDVKKKDEDVQKAQPTVDAGALDTTIADERTRAAEDEAARRNRLEAAVKQNQLPAWHETSAIGPSVKKEEGGVSPNPLLKKEEEDVKRASGVGTEDKKMQDDLDAYMAEMERERVEQERKQAEEGESAEDEDDEDDFEDIPGSSVGGTPVSSQQVKHEVTPTSVRRNGLKRELDLDADSVSGTSTGANTPLDSSITSAPEFKRIKMENGGPSIKSEDNTPQVNGADSDEDEDFEDV